MGVVSQGEVYWFDLGEPLGSEPGYLRPVAVVQSDILNDSGIRTILVCLITSNLRRGAWTGNVTLPAGEAGLPRPSVVEVTGTFPANRFELMEVVGQLSRRSLRRVVAGLGACLFSW